MITTKQSLAAVLLALGLHAQLTAAPAKDEGHTPDPEHARLVAARKATHELPEVLSAEQQSKADRAMTHKALAEYKAARKKSTASEEAYRKAFDAGLAGRRRGRDHPGQRARGVPRAHAEGSSR